jgi:hypothetical protein
MTRIGRILTAAQGVAIAVLGIMFPLASPTEAVVVKDGANNVLFRDNFEGVSTGSEPIAPQVGNWVATSFFTHVHTNASDNDPRKPPGPFHASPPGENKYLRLPRYTAGADPNNPYSPLGPTYMTGANFGVRTSGSVIAEFAMYIPTTVVDFPIGIGLSDQASYTGSRAWIDVLPQQNRLVYYNDSVGTVLIPGVTYRTDVWQVWTLEYIINPGAANDQWRVTIDGVTSSFVPSISAGNGLPDGVTTTLQYLVLRGDNNGATVFVDAAPEPASVGVLAMAGMLLIGRRRRR